jgi:CRP-like cAMP-binding protein
MPDIDYDHLTVFRDLTAEQRGKILPLFVLCELREGETIFEQGELAASLYVVVTGEVAVRYKPDDGPELTVARIRPDGVVGWSAALGSPTYTSSVDCLADSSLLRINSENLRKFCLADPRTGAILLERLSLVIAERLRNTHDYVLALLEHGLRLDMKKYLHYNELSMA